MIVYRTAHKKYRSVLWNGQGAANTGGRWNSIGRPVVYAAESVSLCLLENLVKVDNIQVLQDYVLASANVPEGLIQDIEMDELPGGWANPEVQRGTQLLGDRWMKRDAVAIRVPSAVVQIEWDLILNPLHRDFQLVRLGKAGPLPVDPRLLKLK